MIKEIHIGKLIQFQVFTFCVKCVLNTCYIHFLIWHDNFLDDDLQNTCLYLLIFIWEWWIVCNLKFLVLSLIWVTKFNYGLLKLKNMIFIMLIGHFYVEVFVIVEEVNKLFSFSRHISCIFGRYRVPWKRKNTVRGWKQLYVALWDHDLTLLWG